MKFLIVGDVHGCFYTYQSFLEKYWDPETEILIQVGDVMNKGKYTYQSIAFSMELAQKYPEKFIQLKGNNEHISEQKWIKNPAVSDSFKKVLKSYGFRPEDMIDWITNLPHFYETEHFLISHAGVDKKNKLPITADNLPILYTKEKLIYVGKIQVIGHTFVEYPTFDKSTQCWYLDTGAGSGKMLSGIKMRKSGRVTDIVSSIIKKKDIL